MAQRNDIEDVLSSIRRLVSDEARPAADAAARDATRALILAPTQRVPEPEDPFQTIQDLPEPDAADPQLAAEEGATAIAAEDFESADEPAGEGDATAEDHASRPAPQPEPEIEDEDDDAEDPAHAEDAGPDDAEVDLADLSKDLGSDDALRELIAEIVRQELAGALGERITRNVRKLVRREIRLMMSGEDFD